jgi:DNA-binding response OmpR family regulator
LKILFVEDEQHLRQTIIDILNVEGHICETAANVNDGSDKLDMYEYDFKLESVLQDKSLRDGHHNQIDIAY